ncbi:MAG: ethanolamine ammonia-lyase subunit EutB [Nannocystis sp.]|nr:ethanolamine ammonia-lyase subunit EutB [Nannocystis sp.]
MLGRRIFLGSILGGVAASQLSGCSPSTLDSPDLGVLIEEIRPGEDVFAYVARIRGSFDIDLFRQVIGAANEFKEGDEALGVAAADELSRQNARTLLANTRLGELQAQPLFADQLYGAVLDGLDLTASTTARGWTLGEFKAFLLEAGEDEIKPICPGLGSDVIACVVKLMSNDELIAVGAKVFNPLPGTNIGAKGYMGARIQPNSPTDDLDDIRWQVFNGWAFAVGDVVLGTNPVSSDPVAVAAVEGALQEIREVFDLTDVIPHCVLAHIDIQAAVEETEPGTTGLWFQSLAGNDDANETFGISVDGMLAHAAKRSGKYGLYFETGQGADFTNGHGKGVDMVVQEARKYGFARVLAAAVAAAQAADGQAVAPWVHVNDVAGFIGPEVFRSRDQLVRCCLEDIVMGKLHGIMIGLDICSTLHMEVDLDDLDWCIDQIMPANPGYLMGLPTKNDPMLSYLTTAFQDHVRVREKFGYKVNDAMWAFFRDTLEVIDADGKPTASFGEPMGVFLKFMRARGDMRSDAELLAEGQAQLAAVRGRGVPIAEGHGAQPWDMNPQLDAETRALYADAKLSLRAEWKPEFLTTIPDAVALRSQSADRDDYILHPPTGEVLDSESVRAIEALSADYAGAYDVQILISDGLNTLALMDEGHLMPYLKDVRDQLVAAGFKVAPKHLVLTSGRVRAGYRAGELLFGSGSGQAPAIVHVIGERPGTIHHNYSVYITATQAAKWAKPGTVDHNITRVISGISDTAYAPGLAATETVSLLKQLTG